MRSRSNFRTERRLRVPDSASRWRAVRHVLAAHLGGERDVLALGPALEVLRGELPQIRLTLLTSPEGLRAAPYLPLDAAFKTEALGVPERLARLVEHLRSDVLDAVAVFGNEDDSPHEVAYAAYLAGVPLRLGASREFAGGVLDPWVPPPPPGLLPVQRHLHLLARAGFPEAHDLLPAALGAEFSHPALHL